MEMQQPLVKDNLHHRVRTKYNLVDTENSMTTNNEETVTYIIYYLTNLYNNLYFVGRDRFCQYQRYLFAVAGKIGTSTGICCSMSQQK